MFPNKDTVEMAKALFLPDTRVELLSMNDALAPPVGTKGTVASVDEKANILVHWDNGSSLYAIYGEDKVRIM